MDCFFFKQKTAYEMRISDWSSDVCSSDLRLFGRLPAARQDPVPDGRFVTVCIPRSAGRRVEPRRHRLDIRPLWRRPCHPLDFRADDRGGRWRAVLPRHQGPARRSEEHTSELQSLMRISYAVFCLKKKKRIIITN